MLPLIAQLIASGVGVLGNALATQGKELVEEKLGVKIPDLNKEASPESLLELRRLEFQHQEALQAMLLKQAELDMEAEKTAQVAVTDRWKVDMSSDSWLSKNVRPLSLVYWTVAITILVLLDSIGTAFQVKQPWIDLIQTSYSLILGAYFVGRTIQHVTNIRSKA